MYPDDTINGSAIRFPRHEYQPIRYSLSRIFGNIFQRVLDDMEALTMAPYGIDQYNMDLSQKDRDEHKARARLQTILLLKRFESSIEAVRVSLENKIRLYRYIAKVLDGGRILRVRDFNRIMAKWNASEGADDSAHGAEKDGREEAEFFISELEKVEKEHARGRYDLGLLKKDMGHDLRILNGLLKEVEGMTVDTKMDAVLATILREKALSTESGKVLIFTEYKTTARYITKTLEAKLGKKTVHNANICSITGDTKLETRRKYVEGFAPKANLPDGEVLGMDGIDILVSTEVLSEGQNLQDCNYVINYDLPWNPMRIVQRTGRIDRLTSTYEVIHSRACYPDRELNKLLKLMNKLYHKIDMVNQAMGLDAELLGEEPTPRQFNGSIVPRIRALVSGGPEAEDTIEKIERESDMMPLMTPVNELVRHIKDKGIEAMKEFPMGRRSEKRGDSQKAILAYLQEKPERRVYFVVYDYSTVRAVVPDDDSDAIELAMCRAAEPKHLPMDGADNRESFNQLLKIDEVARKAIREKNSSVRLLVEKAMSARRRRHDKNVQEINKIILAGIRGGRITKDDGEAAMNIVRSHNIRPWEDDISGLLAEYQKSNDAPALVAAIRQKGQWLGVVEEREQERPAESDQESDLKLVGAMFITGETFDPLADKKGVEKMTREAANLE